MALSRKFLKATVIPLKRIAYNKGNIQQTLNDNRTQNVYSDAERHRSKPLIPFATQFWWTQSEQTTAIYDGRNHEGSGWVGTASSSPAGPPNWSESFGSDGTEAMTKALARLNNRHTSLGETLVESAQTFNMIKGALNRIDKILEALYNGNREKVARSIRKNVSKKTFKKIVQSRKAGKSAIDGALAIQYGWLPLVQLLEDAIRTYTEGFYRRGQELGMRSGSSRYRPSEDLSTADFDGLPRGSAGFNALVTNPTLANANGLGLLNPMREAWNKVGLSFVFDWFIPVGTFLSALSAGAGLTFQNGWRTAVAGNRTGTTFQGTRVVSSVYIAAHRIPVTGFQLPDLSVLWTGSGLNTISKVVSFAMLAGQRALSRR